MIPSSLGLFSDAMGVRDRYRISWYDSLIVAAAAMAGCNKLLTEDLQDGATLAGVRIENPFRAES
jgi:predicted nucleic acid-binding protein